MARGATFHEVGGGLLPARGESRDIAYLALIDVSDHLGFADDNEYVIALEREGKDIWMREERR